MMTYEEYLKESKEKGLLKQTETAAANALEKATVDAKTAYEQSLATYGANAEALSRMGLTGSGYSDYLTGQAYAQQRADISKATADYNKTMNAAAYQDYLNYQTEADKYKSNYIKLYNDVLTGKYGKSDIDSIAAQYGISTDSEDYANLGTAADTYETNRQSQIYASLLGDLYDNGYTSDEIKSIAEAYGLTDGSYLEKLTDTATSIADKAYLEDARTKVFDGMFEGLSYEDAKESLDEILADEKLKDLYTDVQKYFEKEFGVINSIENQVDGLTVRRENKSRTLTIGTGKNGYIYELDGKADEKNSRALGTGKVNQVAKVNGVLYVYIEDKKFGSGWFKLKHKKTFGSGDA